MKEGYSMRKYLITSGFVLTIVFLMGIANTFAAQEKGAAKLMQFKPIVTAADAQDLAPGDTVAMACPKCKEVTVSVIEKSAKTGAKPDIAKLQKHLCPGCIDAISGEGQGKQRTDKITHVCKKCGSTDAFCCVMKKGAKKTKGME